MTTKEFDRATADGERAAAALKGEIRRAKELVRKAKAQLRETLDRQPAPATEPAKD